MVSYIDTDSLLQGRQLSHSLYTWWTFRELSKWMRKWQWRCCGPLPSSCPSCCYTSPPLKVPLGENRRGRLFESIKLSLCFCVTIDLRDLNCIKYRCLFVPSIYIFYGIVMAAIAMAAIAMVVVVVVRVLVVITSDFGSRKTRGTTSLA